MPETALDRVMTEQGRMNTWLAAIVDVHPGTVTKWRAGEHMPTPDKQKLINLALGRNDLFYLPDVSGIHRTPERTAA